MWTICVRSETAATSPRELSCWGRVSTTAEREFSIVIKYNYENIIAFAYSAANEEDVSKL